jgi:hypothetical protein
VIALNDERAGLGFIGIGFDGGEPFDHDLVQDLPGARLVGRAPGAKNNPG